MSREVRRVPANWQHPVMYRRPDAWIPRGGIQFVGLFGKDFETELAQHETKHSEHRHCDHDDSYCAYEEERPEPEWGWMPKWADEERTHYQLYQTVSEGTPVSPVFATAEEMIRFLVDEGEWFSEQRYEEASARLLVGSGWAPTMAGNEHGLHGPETHARLQPGSSQIAEEGTT